MRRSSAVPALLVIALAVPMAAEGAEENVAPFFITGDLTIAAATVDEDVVPPQAALPSVVESLITDYDPVGETLAAAHGVAVVGSETNSPLGGGGTWQYYDPSDASNPDNNTDPNDGDNGWQDLPATSDDSAFLLPFRVLAGSPAVPVPVEVRFVPDEHFHGTAALIIRAWDGSGLEADFASASTENTADFAPSLYGGSPTPFSAETRRLEVTVTAVNDAPTLSPVSADLTTIPKNSTTPVKTLLTDLLGNQQDADGESIGLAIASTGGFSCSFSLDPDLDPEAGSGWTDITGLGTSVLCLPATAAIRVTPSGSDTASGTAFTAYAWDGGGTVDPGTRLADLAQLESDGHLSPATGVFTQPVNNTSPVWIGDPAELGSIYIADPDTYEGDISEAQLDELISAVFSDDNGDPSGIAIIGSTGSGTWSIGTDSDLNDLTEGGGPPADDDVVLVSGDQYIRYTPDPYAGSETATLTIRAWDQSDYPGDVTNQTPGGSVSIGDGSDGLRTISVVVTVNQAPSVDDLPDGDVTALIGNTTEVPLTVTDEDPEFVDWEVTGTTGGTLDSSVMATGETYYLRFIPDVESSSGSVTFTVTDADGLSNEHTVTFSIITNLAPVIGEPPGPTEAIAERPTGIDLTATDDGDVAVLTWSVVGYASGGSASFSDPSGPNARLQFTPDGVSSSGSVTVIVTDDQDTQSVPQTVHFTIVPNETPTIVSADPGSVAVAGQPWEALVTVTDGNAGDADLLTISGGPSETWISLQELGGGRYRFFGTPSNGDVGVPTNFSTSFVDPSSASAGLTINVTTVAGTAVTVTGPTLPVSTPGSIVYGAIHPGSSTNLSNLSAQVVSLGKTQARAFWWSSTSWAFGELPSSPASPATAGIFLASLSSISLSFDAPPQAAPYAITLPVDSWSFVGIPPIYIDTETVTQSHAWDDFRLETANGVPIDDESAVSSALGTGTLASTRPWLWDGQSRSYVQVDTLSSGTAYWIRNRSNSAAYRLVRATSGADNTFGQIGALGRQAQGMISAARTAAASAEAPPAPPSSLATPDSSTTSADGGGGSCGAGGLAGLLIAGLALLGLRPRRRN